jgi:hypothetical protein
LAIHTLQSVLFAAPDGNLHCHYQGRAARLLGFALADRRGRRDTDEYVVEISRDLIKLFGRGFIPIEWKQRRALE